MVGWGLNFLAGNVRGPRYINAHINVILIKFNHTHTHIYSFLLVGLLVNVFVVMEKEVKKKGRRSNMKKYPETDLFGQTLEKSTHPHFGAWSLLLAHFQFTPS